MDTRRSAKPFTTHRLIGARIVATLLALLGTVAAAAAPLQINVQGVAADGSLVPISTDYRWTVEEDATKLSIPGQPATPANYSFSFHTSYMPVIAAGRVGTIKSGVAADPDVQRLYSQSPPVVCPATTPGSACLDPTKRYYVSVAADGYQMGGGPVVFSAGGASATVYVNKYSLPTAQLSVFAFNDNNPINGAPDLPAETGLAGFTVALYEAGGTYGQSGGQVTQDAFGNPLGSTYDGDGNLLVKGKGIVLTGPDGTATIKNLFPAKYTVVIMPPVGSDWHQTSTIEGTRGSDAWVKNNEPSFFQEFGPPGHHVFIGFTRSGCIQGNLGGRCVGLTGGNAHAIVGKIVNVHNSRPPLYNFETGAPVPECWVGLNETNGGTRALYATACNKDSTFRIPNVPGGTYELVVWDEPLDMIIGTQTVTVPDAAGGDVNVGSLPVFSWFARYQGRVFQDIDGTGLPFFDNDVTRTYVEVNPVTGIETVKQGTFKKNDLKPPFGEGIGNNIRFRDGSIYQSVTTKKDGTFAFTELFPFFNWMIAEIDYARFKATGATMVVDGGGKIVTGAGTTAAPGNDVKLWKAQKGLYGSNDPAYAYDPWSRLNPQLQPDGTYYRTENCGADGCAILLEGIQTFLGQTNHIEWGKQPYAATENGGIAGIVHYAITRAEDDPRYAAAENWEPGIPHVQVNLYLDCDGDGKVDKPNNDGTGNCAGTGLSSNGYIADLPDVDNYPFCWRDPQSCGLPEGSPGVMGPEDVCRSAACKAAMADPARPAPPFSYGDVFTWGSGAAVAVGLGTTDAWDDKIPDQCVKGPSGTVTNGGIPFASQLDCFDGLYNFNQIRPAVFDGGYAFGRVAGQAELPMVIGPKGKGTYIVEANAPPGYLHQGNGDKNVVFGDELHATPAALPFECVGIELDVPETLTLFPGEINPNYAAGQRKWKKCDMKAVALLPGMNPAPDFFMFTEAPVAGHGVGFILDDTASEFNRFSPTFGEKYAPPHLPISIQDWTGREISRVYSDQFGSYNFLVPSSFTINPPFPSGVMPSMMVSCMNHPGPITDERPNLGFDAQGRPIANPTFGKKIIDPFFNRKYTQFCYTLQYLPGKTTYLDTPVLPVAAYASVEKNPLDCECQDKTPGIYSVNNPASVNAGNNGPWLPRSGGTLTIVSSGDVEVPNPAYDPNDPLSPKHIVRDYGFGAGGTVKLGTLGVVVTNWQNDLITLTVPGVAGGLPAGEYQLTVTRSDSGKESVVGLTVHVNNTPPITVAPGSSIQAVIDSAPADSLITIPPGTYNEYVILDKRLRLQGWGADSVTINASKASAGGLGAWRALLNKKIAANTFDLLPGQTAGIDVPDNEPTLFGAEEGPGILVVGKSNNSNNNPDCANRGRSLRIDGLTISGSDAGGGVLASGYACGLRVTNNKVVGNYGAYGGGIRIGHTALVNGDAYTDGVNRNVVIDHNWISQNGASEVASGSGGGGGVTLGTGSDDYVVSSNYVCGNFSMSDGGGVSHVGRSGGTSTIARNTILLNQTFNQSADPTGGGIFIGGHTPLAGATSDGTGNVNVDANLIQYNQAGAGAGGGVSIANTGSGGGNQASNVVLTNNMIVNNSTAYAGGGVAFANASANVRLVNNTVASNASTATNRQSFPPGPKTQSSAQVAGIALLGGTAPTLLNNIVWHNQSYIWRITPADPNQPQTTTLIAQPGYSDLGANLQGQCATNCVLSGGNVAFVKAVPLAVQTDPDQPVVLAGTTIMQTALTFDEGGNFINVIFSPLSPFELASPATLRGDYHLVAAGSNDAINRGANRTNGNRVPTADFDGQLRPATGIDIGADELAAAVPTLTGISPNSGGRPGSYSVTLTGTNLTGATLTEGTAGLSISNVVVVSATQITATITVTAQASLGPKTLTVTTAGGSATITFSVVTPPPPMVTAMTPSSGARPVSGSISYFVTLTGTDFGGATLSENSSGIGITNVAVVNATQITATITVQAGATLGPKTITVTTPGGTATATFNVTAPPPAPTLTSISPNSGARGSSYPVTLTGTNLTGATLTENSNNFSVINVQVVNSTHITGTLVTQANTPIGAKTLTVTTAGGSATVQFTVTN